MAQPALLQEDLKALEQTLRTFTCFSSIMTSSSILSTNIQSVTDHLAANSDILSRIVAFPSTNFPGRTQEALLLQLLRKKLEPQVEAWVDEGRNLQIDNVEAGDNQGDIEETWKWAAEWIGPRIGEYALNEGGDEYTVEEREIGVENVNTGLKDEEESDEEDEEEEDDDEVMEGMGQRAQNKKATEKGFTRKDGRVRSKEEILRFATSGVI
ncbi:mediator of RNA polymerase II transcription subunit 8 [Ciborinia camelliae]|nr:mediator of RNA polymerase II transcription subunit 8 [Ciborinia camelliae]